MNEYSDMQLIDNIVSKYEGERGTLIPILQEVQQVNGYLSRDVMKYIAQKTGKSASIIYGIVTFYTQFRLQPIGKNIIRICNGTACHVSNAIGIIHSILDYLGVKEGETTKDGKFTVEIVACLGCCSLAPVIMINEKTYGRLTPDKIKKILAEY
ncbi:MAG: NADH-quinone oxidoreductase subunit NuoE [Candidatus Cloacimonadota bacterium]|nr:MAG: NADH-quinone oxidoreductase subunit NuoE [Candidatus Cloacimonadota bacterium]